MRADPAPRRALANALSHLAPAAARDLTGFYHADGQTTPGPEPELHGAAREGVTATPWAGAFGGAAALTAEEIEERRRAARWPRRSPTPASAPPPERGRTLAPAR